MGKRDSWDKINRQKKVLNTDYREELRQRPRGSHGINIEGIMRRAERRVQKDIDTVLGSVRWYGPKRRTVMSSTPGGGFVIDQPGLGGARRSIVISSALSEWLAQNEIDKARLVNAICSLLGQLEQIKNSQQLRQLQERSVPMQFLMWNRVTNEAHEGEGGFRISKVPDKLVLWLLKFKKNKGAPRSTACPT